MAQSAEYKQEVMNWRIKEEDRIQSIVDKFLSYTNNDWNGFNDYKLPFLKQFITGKSSSKLFFYAIRLLQQIKDSVRHPEVSHKDTGNAIALISHNMLNFNGRGRSRCGNILYFLLIAGFVERATASDVKSEEFRERMASFVSTKKQSVISEKARSLEIKETSLLYVPHYDEERFALIESRLRVLSMTHARRSGLTYAYVYTVFGKEVADKVFPFNQALSQKFMKDQEDINRMKAFVLEKIHTYGFFRLQMFKAFNQIGRTGNTIKRGFNYTHWKLVQAILLMEGHLVYERAGGALMDLVTSDKDEEANAVTKRFLVKPNGRWACPCVLVDRYKYFDYKFATTHKVSLRNRDSFNMYILRKNPNYVDYGI